MNLHIKEHLPQSVKSAIFEDEPNTTPATPAPVVAPPPQFQTPTTAGYQTPIAVTGAVEASDHTDDAYQRLLAKTDFTQTPVFQAINKYLAPLAGTGMDDKMKFGVALKQAQAIDHLDPASVLGVFDKFNDDLTAAANNIAQAVVNRTHSEVDAKTAKAAELQAQAKQLTEEAFNAQQDIQQKQHRFDVALKTRQDELAQEKAKYASFLA